MKTIIIYSTKYGTVEKAAKMLKSKISGDVQLINVQKEQVPSLQPYDNVVLGGSIYIGMIQKELKNYINNNLSTLLQKRVGLFICGASPDASALVKEIETSYPAELFKHAVCKEVFGHEINFPKLKFFDKLVLRMVQGNNNSSSNISEEKITKFAKELVQIK